MTLEALKGARVVKELVAGGRVHPIRIHRWKKAMPDGAAELFARGGRKAAEADEDTLRSFYAKIGDCAIEVPLVRARWRGRSPMIFCHQSSSP